MSTFRQDIKAGTLVPQMKTDDYSNQSVTEEKLKDGNVTTPKLADASVTTEKIAGQSIKSSLISDAAVTEPKIHDQAVTTPKLADRSIINDKLADASVDGRTLADSSVQTKHISDSSVTTKKVADKSITHDKMADDSVNTPQLVDKSVVNSKLADTSVSTTKLQDGSVTNQKIAPNTMTIDKFDPELRKAVEAATGLPENLVEMIQDVDLNLAKLNDTVYPIVLGLSINPDLSKMQTEVKYSVSSDGKPLTPDYLRLSKNINDSVVTAPLTITPSASGVVTTPIEGNKEIFELEVSKQGRTKKSTNLTRYLCYYGGNSAEIMTAEILNVLAKASTPNVSFNPKITTNDNDYIWLVVPSYLSINRVTSAGFDVTLSTPQTITNSLGTFKAYRTINPLTTNTWNLVIS